MPMFHPVRASEVEPGHWCTAREESHVGDKNRNYLPCMVIPHPAELDRTSLGSPQGTCL